MNITDIQGLAANDMSAVDKLINARLQSDVALINQLGHYIVHSGGKRLRPLLLILVARACGYQGSLHILLATIVEFIHTATLLHDDVVDASEMRRGEESANAVWGNEASVLVGDFLYSRAFQMMVEANEMRVMMILADTTNTIAKGEVMQLLNAHNPDTTEEEYLKVILNKTAKLFEACCQLGGVVAEVPKEKEVSLAKFGLYLGTAFQLIDDVLDYSASSDEIGKNIGDDLAEGKPTLPVIYALKSMSGNRAKEIRQAIKEGGLEHIDVVMQAIHESGAIEYTREIAHQQAKFAQQSLESVVKEGPYKEALKSLAELSVNRSS